MPHAIAVLVVSTAPALAFLILILALDRRESEPLALVLLPLLAGLAAFGILALRKGRRLSLARWGAGPIPGPSHWEGRRSPSSR